MKDPVDQKTIGKFLEELGECTAAASRCFIQGIDEREPVTGKLNREWLEEEIADVLANIELVGKRFGLDQKATGERVARKIAHLRKWHSMA